MNAVIPADGNRQAAGDCFPSTPLSDSIIQTNTRSGRTQRIVENWIMGSAKVAAIANGYVYVWSTDQAQKKPLFATEWTSCQPYPHYLYSMYGLIVSPSGHWIVYPCFERINQVIVYPLNFKYDVSMETKTDNWHGIPSPYSNFLRMAAAATVLYDDILIIIASHDQESYFREKNYDCMSISSSWLGQGKTAQDKQADQQSNSNSNWLRRACLWSHCPPFRLFPISAHRMVAMIENLR